MITALLTVLPFHVNAQRKTMALGRGVVAVARDSKVNITWRRLAQEPEDARYNIYVNNTKVNASPTPLTNYQTTTTAIASGSLIEVAMVDANGVEGKRSVPFRYVKDAWPNVAFKVNFEEAGSPLKSSADFGPKFIWPVDLDGDGEMEYVVNRLYGGRNFNGYDGWGDDKLGGDCLEAYTREGKHLWTVNLGVNFFSFSGQNDGVTVGDFDGDGKGEVMVQTCEGARFWDAANNTFGKYLYYNGQQAHYNGTATMQTVSSDGTDPDIDGDGIVNYSWQNKGKNPQHYMVVIDGMTGAQKDVCPMTMPKDNDMSYTRTNKSAFMGDEYPYLSPAMGSAFLDGKHQSAVAQFQVRTTNGTHHYFTYAYGYEGGAFHELFTFAFRDNGNPTEFHHIRIGDVDGDGKDEVMNGAFALDHDGKVLWNANISHGDRFRMSDIDPDLPGQEIFAIQQNAPDMLGQVLYSATTGESIKRWYMSSVGDVGRGECMDVDPAHKGYEMWSTMPNMYDAKGNVIASNKPYPAEGMWWDDNLGRECCWENGSNDHNLVIGAGGPGSTGWSRMLELSKASNWQAHGESGGRPLFWGDSLGDWREEIILKTNTGNVWDGFACYSTDYSTQEKRIYCLLEDPNYFGQITNRGYYQTPNTSFYLGYDMPRPPLPPVMKETTDTKVFDLTMGNATIPSLSSNVKHAYFMPVKGQTQTVTADAIGTSADLTLWKGMQGRLLINGDMKTAARLVISEGTVEVNGSLKGITELRARGVLTGNGTVDTLTLEGSQNYAEGVIRPVGTLAISKSLNINVPTFIDIDTDNNSMLKVNGDLTISKTLTFNMTSAAIGEGSYKLMEYTGQFIGDVQKVAVRGVTGLAYSVDAHDNALYLTISGTREPTTDVVWTGEESATWNYKDKNFSVEGLPTTFVADDAVIFNDDAKKKTITIPELLPIKDVLVTSSTTYTFQGNGGLTGNGTLRKEGEGKLYLNNKQSDYKGATILNGGTTYLTELSMQGSPSSIGVGTTSPDSWQCGKATMVFNGSSLATDRGIQLNDTTTFEIPAGNSTTLKGLVKGNGVLKKTGTGQLSISYSAANQWKSTILNSGILAQGTYNTTFGTASSLIHVTGNSQITQFYTTNSGNAPNFSNPIEIDTLRTLTFTGTGRGTFRSNLRGKGTIVLSSGYVRFDNYMTGEDFKGTITLNGGAGRLVQAMTMPKATLNIASGVTAESTKAGGSDLQSFALQFGNVTGAGVMGAGTWTIGSANRNATFTGRFTSTVNKVGSSIWYLNPTASSTGVLNINDGVVLTNGTVPVTTATINVNSGAWLRGKGQTTNVIVKNGGTIGACSFSTSTLKENTVSGTMTITGSLTVNAGGIIDVLCNSLTTSISCGKLKVNGNATLNSPVINLRQYTEGKKYLADKDMQIINCAGTLTINGDVTIYPKQPQKGYAWDMSQFTEKGIITVRMLGDINSDGKVTLADANLLVNYLLGTASDVNLTWADVNLDGKIDMQDAKAIADLIIQK